MKWIRIVCKFVPKLLLYFPWFTLGKHSVFLKMTAKMKMPKLPWDLSSSSVSRGNWAQWQTSFPGERASELGRETFGTWNKKESFSAELGDVDTRCGCCWGLCCLLTRLESWGREGDPCGEELTPSSITEVGMRLALTGNRRTPACLEDKMGS